MFCLPTAFAPGDKEKFAFDTDDFKVFGNDGVIVDILKRNSMARKITHKVRIDEPDVGDPVGWLETYFLDAFSIQAVGFVAAKRGTRANPVYDIWVTQSEPLCWHWSFIWWAAKKKEEMAPLGLVKDIQPHHVVKLRDSAHGKYSAFTLDDKQKQDYRQEVERLKTEESEKRKKKLRESREKRAKKG